MKSVLLVCLINSFNTLLNCNFNENFFVCFFVLKNSFLIHYTVFGIYRCQLRDTSGRCQKKKC